MPGAKPEVSTRTTPRSKDRPVSRVWMLSQECAGLAQAGGLGEAVAGLSRTLAVDSKLDVSVFLPSHGRHLDSGIRGQYSLRELTTFIAQGHRTGVNGHGYNYLVGMERGSREGVNYFLAKGLDSVTSKSLDDPVIYDHENTFEKMSLLARTLGTYTEYLVSTGRSSELPDLIHAHDWHMVPAGVLVKQRLQERGVIVPLVFTIHLLSGVTLPWHYASEDWSGIRDTWYSMRTDAKPGSTLKYSQLWQEVSHNSLEKFGCYMADYVTSVSKSYLANDVRNHVGEIIRGKSGHIYNGCDWDPSNIESSIIPDEFEKISPRTAGKAPKRVDLRKYLLTRAISKIRKEPETEDPALPNKYTGKKRSGTIETFSADGPLVLMTGRLSPQKGADVLLAAVPQVLAAIPETKFLLFLLPSNDPELTRTTFEVAAKYPENVRVILGKHPAIYLLSHLAADAYAMPSRSEPFGISALEAMVTGNPVVGTNVGGISETVLDLSQNEETGTGFLVPPENVAKLAESLISLLTIMQLDERMEEGKENRTEVAGKIPLEQVAEMVSKDRHLGSKIRENCRNRVMEKFRWTNAGRMALDRYCTAKLLVSRRGQS